MMNDLETKMMISLLSEIVELRKKVDELNSQFKKKCEEKDALSSKYDQLSRKMYSVLMVNNEFYMGWKHNNYDTKTKIRSYVAQLEKVVKDNDLRVVSEWRAE